MTLLTGEYVIASWLFLRFLGAIYLVAFASFGVQATGLVGQQGILPAGAFLESARQALGKKAILQYPTLAWINASDAWIKSFCIAGFVISALLLLGVQSTLVLLLAWVLYLSLVNIGQVFLSYQWDLLLLETGFIAIFLVPPSLLPRQAATPPPPLVIFLFHALLFRLIFMSGALKILSRDPTWRGLTALCYHYETQPIPNPLAWYFHQAPEWFHKLSTLFALGVEILIPFLYFIPGPPLWVAAALTILLQVLIQITGNFAFFNLLTIAIPLLLLQDAVLRPLLPDSLLGMLDGSAGAESLSWGSLILIPLSAFLLLAGAGVILSRLVPEISHRRPVQTLFRILTPAHLVNPYGLFTVMTTVRPEIVVEGSLDGESWLPYRFKYKAGDLQRSPPFVAPHQPRLDWQMWFAALSSFTQNPWFLQLAIRLVTGSQPVLSLLADSPFPDRPPKYLRAVLYDYQFTSREEKAATGNWWRREKLGLYLPPISIGDQS